MSPPNPTGTATPPFPATAAPYHFLLSEYRSQIIGGTLLSHFAHWRYLTRFRRLHPESITHRAAFRFHGVAWGLVYLGVLSTVTIAEQRVKRPKARREDS
jgi:hypothetical protein